MKKTIKLKESDIARIVRRVISENEANIIGRSGDIYRDEKDRTLNPNDINFDDYTEEKLFNSFEELFDSQACKDTNWCVAISKRVFDAYKNMYGSFGVRKRK